MNRLMQGLVAAIAPDQAETPSSAGLNQLIRDLRDEFDLDIAPRESNYSPARQGPTLGNAVFARIQFLYFTDKPGLDQSIHEYRQELNNRRGRSSAQSRTQLLHEQLNDPAWFSKERLQATPRSKRFTPLTSYTTPSSTQQPQITRFDSGPSQNDTEPDSMPPSPSVRKFKGEIEIKPSNSARQQMQQASSDYGSSWEDHGLEVDQPMETSKLDFSKALEYLDGTKTPTTHVAKRKKIDENKTEALTDPAEELQGHSAGGRKGSYCHWQIRDLVRDGFGARYNYTISEDLPFAVSVERARLRQDAGLDKDQVISAKTHQDVKNMLESQAIDFKQSHPSIWDSPSQHDGGSLAGTISLNPKSDDLPLFQLRLQPMVLKSSSVERRFGSDRFLKVILPSFEKQVPGHLQSDKLQSAFLDWLLAPKDFLGRTYRIYDIKTLKSSKSSSKRAGKANKDHLKHLEVYFFATAGLGIAQMSWSWMINWQISIKDNLEQSLLKAFSRLPLSNRHSTPTVCFEPTQILMVDDIFPNAEPEDDTFEDPAFKNKPRKLWAKDEAMTDGCAMISVGAALLIRETAGITDFPSAFQGRINGHKGMWHVSGSYETSNPKHLEIWIQVRPSQRKVVPRAEDLDERCEANRWCFGLLSWSKPASHADIHKDFIPVLHDRGVSQETLRAVIGEAIDLPIEASREAIQDVEKFTLWSHEHFAQDFKDPLPERQVGLPVNSMSKCQLLINKTGYTPFTNHIVAKSATQMIEGLLQQQRISMKFMCIKSTSVVGIADPLGVLKPGEVHFSLSRPLVDEPSGQRFDLFAGNDVLVARDPTLRPSDMQKVRCVCHPELAHLKDVVVFPSRGQIPLAAKLQGGDYDGDKFLVIADERLVGPFRNALVLPQAGIKELGIRQVTQRLGDVVREEDIGTDRHIEAFFRIAIPFVLRESMLGVVTNYLYDLIYYRNELQHPEVVLVTDVHDTIIDASKNGYMFDRRDWQKFLATHKLPRPSVMKRKYHDNLNALKPGAETAMSRSKVTLRDVVSEGSGKRYRRILDDIVFNVINPKYAEFLDWLYASVVVPATAIDQDPDLEYPLRELKIQAAKAGLHFPIDVEKEVQAFKKNVEPVAARLSAVWAAFHASSEATRDMTKIPGLPKCIEDYRAIRPTQDCYFWDMRTAETAPTKWECFKVAVLASLWQFERRKSLLFWAATDVIQYLKSHSETGRRVIEQVQAVLKPKRPKQPRNTLVRSAKSDSMVADDDDDDDDDDDGETTEEDDFDEPGLVRDVLESFS
jgi:hypothetical protein